MAETQNTGLTFSLNETTGWYECKTTTGASTDYLHIVITCDAEKSNDLMIYAQFDAQSEYEPCLMMAKSTFGPVNQILRVDFPTTMLLTIKSKVQPTFAEWLVNDSTTPWDQN